MIRVLHCVNNMHRAGLETMLMNYHRRIDRSKVQFDYLVHRDFEADYDREILSLGGKIHRLPTLNPFSQGYLRALDAFFAQHPEYKIVHSHLDCMAGIPLKAAKAHGVPVRIAHAHSTNQTLDLKYPLKLYFKRGIAAESTHRFACAEDAGKWMFSGAPFQVLHNAVDTALYRADAAQRAQVRSELSIAQESRVIGHVGRFATPKNHAFILQIFAAIYKNNPQATLLLVGDGELRSQIEKQADALGLRDRIIMTGVRTDVHRLLQAMDVFLFPSIYEGLPVSIVEAQAAGLPCLISDKVPIQCKLTDLVWQLSLSDSADFWAQKVLEVASIPRTDTSAQIRNAGFDIAENAQKLTDFYLTAWENA